MQDSRVQDLIRDTAADGSTDHLVINMEPDDDTNMPAPATHPEPPAPGDTGAPPAPPSDTPPLDSGALHAVAERGLEQAKELVRKVEAMKTRLAPGDAANSGQTHHHRYGRDEPLPVPVAPSSPGYIPKYSIGDASLPAQRADATNDLDRRVYILEGVVAQLTAQITAVQAAITELQARVGSIDRRVPTPAPTHKPTLGHKPIQDGGDVEPLGPLKEVPDEEAPCASDDDKPTISVYPGHNAEVQGPNLKENEHHLYKDRKYQVKTQGWDRLFSMRPGRTYGIVPNHVSYKRGPFCNLTMPVSGQLFAFNDQFDDLGDDDNATENGWVHFADADTDLGAGPLYERNVSAGTFTLDQGPMRHATCYFVVLDENDQSCPCPCEEGPPAHHCCRGAHTAAGHAASDPVTVSLPSPANTFANLRFKSQSRRALHPAPKMQRQGKKSSGIT